MCYANEFESDYASEAWDNELLRIEEQYTPSRAGRLMYIYEGPLVVLTLHHPENGCGWQARDGVPCDDWREVVYNWENDPRGDSGSAP